MFAAGETAPNGAGTLTLALSHQGRGDLLVGISDWFQATGLIGDLWIPAFAGMTGRFWAAFVARFSLFSLRKLQKSPCRGFA